MCNYAVLVIWRVVAITIAIINLYLCVFIGLSFGDDNKRRESVNIDCSSPLRSVSDNWCRGSGIYNAENNHDR